MISVEELFVDKKYPYPEWIKTNPVFTKLDYVRKVFPDIGLSNFEEKIVIDNTSEIASCANQLLDVITDYLNARTTKLTSFAKKGKVGKKRRRHLDSMLSIMTTLMDWLRNNKKAFITTTPNGRVSLSLPNDLFVKDVLFMKRGTSLLKIYEKLNSLLKEDKFLTLKDISQAFQFKNFSAINIPSKEMFVKFSSDQVDGLWDIATMSMRGVSSCQTWSIGNSNDGKVIGSMIDPFTAIIYLTCGGTYNIYGSKMVRRCVVRYVIDQNNKVPYLLLERMYPSFEKPSLDTFVKVIKERAPKGMEVYYTVDVGEKAGRAGTKLSFSYVPLSDEIKLLEPRFHPYCDSSLTFKEDASCLLAKNTQTLRTIFKSKIPKLFEKALQSGAFKKANIKPYGVDASKLISQLRGTKLKTKIGLTGDPNAIQICNCTNVSCNRNHTPFEYEDEIETEIESNIVEPQFDPKFITDLSNRFTEFVCKLSAAGDPFKYLINNRKECSAFFASEFGDTINAEFAEFLISNIIEYIDQKNPLK